jgi:hypothetical protein
MTDKPIKAKRSRSLLNPKPDSELIKEFWDAPMSAFFNQKTVAPVRGISAATLENERWLGRGIPYRKIRGRVLYQKADVVAFLEGHELINKRVTTLA